MASLYLDAARMGQMDPSTLWAVHDFVRLAGEVGCTLYFERFLKDGFQSWPSSLRTEYPALACWGGMRELKHSLAEFVGLSNATDLFLSSRSTNLMRLAAKLLHHGRPVVVTDLTWPNYLQILRRESVRKNTAIVSVQLRSGIFRGKLNADDVADRVVSAVLKSRAGGVFLPAISHQGIRLPFERVVAELRRLVPDIVIVVDGSQAFGQMPLDLTNVPCDMFLAGCHKWFGSPLPLGVGFFANPATAASITDECRRLVLSGRVDDPLLAFLDTLETGHLKRFTETVNLSPLFACRGALQSQHVEGELADRYLRRTANAKLVRRLARMTLWNPLPIHEDFQSASVLLTPSRMRYVEPADLRARFHDLGVAVTAYRQGLVRLAMSSVPFTPQQIGTIIQALALSPQSSQHHESMKC